MKLKKCKENFINWTTLQRILIVSQFRRRILLLERTIRLRKRRIFFLG